MSIVLDASAVLAWLQEESGAGMVGPLLSEGIVTAANWAEILQKVRQHERIAEETAILLKALGIDVVAVIEADGAEAARLWTRERRLSLGDRICLAVAGRLGLPVVTADRLWGRVDAGTEVRLIR